MVKLSSGSVKRLRSPDLDTDHRILEKNHVDTIQTPEVKLLKTGDTEIIDPDSTIICRDAETESIIRSASSDMLHQDPRRRRDALAKFVDVGQALDFTLYPEFIEALNDDYERCRSYAIKLILLMSLKYGSCLVFQKGTDEQVRLEDDAFAKICRMMTDSAVQVRVEAAKAISQFRSASLSYLIATLDKKQEVAHSGAFVFGLEDERKDVRMASLESLCHLSKLQPEFAEKSIDHIVDMFNDEIEDIRLKAIQCLQDIDNIVLRDYQVEIILSVLDSPSMDIREALHDMLAHINLSSARSIRRCIESVLTNLTRYPQDKLSIFNCFKSLGRNHPTIVASLVNELLAVHPYLKLPEHSLIDDQYIATLILIFNAAAKQPSIIDSLESHTQQHQTYIRHTLPSFMPQDEVVKSQSTSAQFFIAIFDRLGKMLKSKSPQRSKISLMNMSLSDLKSFGQVEPEFRASTDFYRIVLESILMIAKLVSAADWLDSILSLKPIRKVLDQTFCLLRRYHKLSLVQVCCIQQLRIQALAMELIVFIRSSNASALDLCDSFMEEVRSLETFLSNQPFLDSIALNDSSNFIMSELSSLDSPKPGTVARKLEPLFSITSQIIDQLSGILLLLIESQKIDDLRSMKTSSATVNSALEEGEAHKFTAGLVLALTLDATIENIPSIDEIRIKVTYPDKQAHIIVPIAHHFRLISSDKQSQTSSYRLYTTVNICHNIWTDPSFVDLSIILDHRENQSTSIDLNSTDQTRSAEESQLIEICKPINFKIHPQNRRW